MALRTLVDPTKIRRWIEERHGAPVRRKDGEDGFTVSFWKGDGILEPVTWEDFLQTFRDERLVMLVDDEAGKTFHRIYRHR
jgi:hypothetical protein